MVTSSQNQQDVITDVITHGYDDITETPVQTATSSDGLWQKILLGVVMFFIVGVTVVGNGLVLLVAAREKRLRTTFNMMIVNLAFTDFLVGLIAMSFYAAFNIYESWPFGEFLCGLWIFTDFGMTLASIFTLLAISVDRFWSVHWSNHYRTHNTPRKARLIIAVIWSATIVIWVPAFIVDRVANSKPNECIYDPALNKEFVVVVGAVGYHGSTAVMLFCYVKVFIFMRRRSKTGPLQKKVLHVNNGTKSDHRETKLDESSETGETPRAKHTAVANREDAQRPDLQRAPGEQDNRLTSDLSIQQETAPSALPSQSDVFRTETSGAGLNLRPEDANSPTRRPPDHDLDSGIDSVDNITNNYIQRKHKRRTDPERLDAKTCLGNAIDMQQLQSVGNVSKVKGNMPALLKPCEGGVEGERSVLMTGGEEGVDVILRRDHSLYQGQNNSIGVQNTGRDRQGAVPFTNANYSMMEEGDESGPPPQSGLSVVAGVSSTQVKQMTTSSNSLARERKLFLTLTYIIVAFLICWMPFHVSFDIVAIDPDLVPSSFYAVTYWLAYINSAANPFLYHSSSPEFRKAFTRLCGR